MYPFYWQAFAAHGLQKIPTQTRDRIEELVIRLFRRQDQDPDSLSQSFAT